MKKASVLFILAVIVPSLMLAGLALQSLRHQQLALERQRSLRYEGVAEGIAKEVRAEIAALQDEFAQQVERLLGKREPAELAEDFDARLLETWPLADLGFAVTVDGVVRSPSLLDRPTARRFRLENDPFLCSREDVEVIWNSPKGKSINLTELDAAAAKEREATDKSVFATRAGGPEFPTSSSTVPGKPNAGSALTQFSRVLGEAHEGTFARFLNDRLNLLFWYRSQRDLGQVFGARIRLDRLIERLRPRLHPEAGAADEVAVALRDDGGRTVASAPAGFAADGRPLGAVEIGEVLPHWEIAAFPRDAGAIAGAVTTSRWTVGLLIGLLLVAIGVGGWLIVNDARRQSALARRKTDFVSNVSHELKTPLTSIRLFSEMLAEGRVAEPAKQRQFLQILSAEAARLTRLINNVLDFARLDRGEKRYRMTDCEVCRLVRDTVETYRPHLEAAGFRVELTLPAEPVTVRADPDAIAQVLVNLLSNAEKYSGPRKEVAVILDTERLTSPHPATTSDRARITVLDRGLGVPPGCEQRIFDQFYRAHDSLGSGIPGSGLGLTLARQIARAHGGEVTYAPREGGGSGFHILLPHRPPDAPPSAPASA